MIPYSAYIKQAAEPTRPSYTSATETEGKAFQAPRYYDRPGVNPELAAQGKQLEADYARMFPYGDYTYSTKGWGYRGGERAQMGQQEIDLRNRFRLYEAQARGISPINPQAVAPSPSAASAFIGDLARSPVMPTALPMYAYDIGTKGLRQATADKAQSDAVYGGMLVDAGKRVVNRYGGNFELQYNDPLLDYSSYALEAAPSLLMAAGTGGGSIGAQTTAQTARTAAPSALRVLGQTVAKGFQPVLQEATNPVVRFAGKAIPTSANYAISGLNPVPLLTGAAQTAPGAGKVFAQLGAHFATQGAAKNYANAARDTAAFNAANPNVAGTPESAMRFGESLLAGGVSLDPTALNPYGIGASSLLPAINDQRQLAIDQATQLAISKLPEEQQAMVLNNPAQIAEVRKQIAAQSGSSFIEPAAEAVSFNPFRALGAASYAEDLAANKDVGSSVATSAIGLPNTALQDPRFFDDLDALAQNPESINSSVLGQHLMRSPIANLVGGDPQNVVGAAHMMTNLNSMLSNMYYTYQQTGQLPTGYAELAQQADNLAKAQQLPVAIQESGNTPFLDALLQLQPVMDKVYQGMQQTQGATQ
jgi:hypothetical protein